MTVSLDELRQRITSLEGRERGPDVAIHPVLRDLLAMRGGGVYGVDAASLATALLAGPSADGAWGAVVGAVDLGLEAAAAAGVDLSRTLFVPDPGDTWFEVTAVLIDAVSVVVVRPPTGVSQGQAARLAARLRKRQSVLVVWGQWPRCDARLSLVESRWSGVGDGHGHLVARCGIVEVRRGAAPVRRHEVWMPDADLATRAVESPAQAPIRSVS